VTAAAAGAAGGRTGALEPAPDVVERALASSSTGACAVIVTEASEAEVRFACNTTTTNGVRRDRRVAVVAFRAVPGGGTAAGVASGSGAVDVAELVAAAEADATRGAPADDASDLVPGEAEVGFGEPAPQTGLQVLSGVLGELGEAFQQAGQERRVLAGFAEHSVVTTYLGTTTGLRRRHVQPTGRLQLVARTDDGTSSAWAGVGTTDFSGISVHDLHDRLARRLGWAKRTVSLEPGRYETVLPPDAVADLMCMVGEALSGRDAEDGHSVFSRPGGGTRVGDVLAPLPFELRSDPAEPGLECAPFLATGASSADASVFDNGLPLAATWWVAGGRLERLRYHRAGARRSGVAPAPPVDNLVLSLPGADASVEDLVARTTRGLLVTCLWYIREVDPTTLLLTGLTRDGVYLVEDGEVTAAVNNFRFNESPVDLLGRVVEAGATQRCLSREWNEWFPRTAMPALRVADFNMSSVSPAT